jgi:hypothetical protein
MLTEKLAKAKGLPIYGHTESRGDFKGGKKVEDRDTDKDTDRDRDKDKKKK